MKRLVEYLLYTLIFVGVFIVMADYKYQPRLTEDEYEAIEQSFAKIENQRNFLTNESKDDLQDLSDFVIDTSTYSPAVGITQDLLRIPADGYYGEDTKQAIMQFQREHNLTVNGNLNQEVLEKIMEEKLPLSESDINNYSFVYNELMKQVRIDESEQTINNLRVRLNEQMNADLTGDHILNEKVFMLLVKDT